MLPEEPNDDDPYAASDLVAIELEGDTGPGILAVTLHEAAEFTIPDAFQEAVGSDSPAQDNTTTAAKPTRIASQDNILPYAILAFDRSVALVKASSGTIQNPLWNADTGSSKFDVFNPSELTVSLFVKNSDDNEEGEHVLLGSVQIEPTFMESQISSEWFQSEGAGKMRITMEYTRKKTLGVGPLGYGNSIGHGGWGDIYTALKKDTKRMYAFKEIPKSEIIPLPEVSRIRHSQAKSPFIIHVTFISQVRTTVCLFSPVVQGGHLFHRLQGAHHFGIKQSTFYAAEILCALEAIHEAGIVYYGPRPKSILLDSLGHIALCDFTLCSVEKGSAESTSYLEYPAPETISGQGFTTAEKWWTLGVLLYEMLTGLPPFYDTDVNEVYRKILFEPLQLPELLSLAAKDILAKLLTQDPDFVRNLDKLLLTPNQVDSRSLPIEEDSSDDDSPVHPRNSIINDDEWEIVENEGWKLVWDSTDQIFYFSNPFTHASEEITIPYRRKRNTRNGLLIAHQLTDDTTCNANFSEPPTQEAKRYALEAILKARYKHLIPQLLGEYGMDSNFYLFHPEVTPLYHAVELEDVELAKRFLDAGAESNMKKSLKRVPLIRAVEKGNQELTELLVQSTDRVNCTLALGQAVRQQAIHIVNILLANGVKCEFEESDRPPPRPVEDIWLGCTLGLKHRTPIDWFMPPLIYAVKTGNKDLVRRLLAHGADANVGYHDLASKRPLIRVCGRPIQLAMELKHHDIVQLLLDFGADICLAQPIKRSHSCSMMSREEHLEATAALMEAAASRNVTSLIQFTR
ncbi:AGC/AKT protein kinase [Trichoderma gamsii]|uniref:AGC/AKT protein kinase n=1 Tax=Trichoderma gamsii TaxID=398673 RepID=A0A2P4ZTW5_9HYPO|nr:AGC/AKT protein kinase [Trichoderma gamsii]PON27722.1 AGC/AKT protein kinase [Trichoderma gamsii]